MDRLRGSLESLSQVAFIVTCVALTSYVLVSLTRAAIPTQRAAEENAPYKIGETIPTLPSASFAARRITAVLFVQSSCRFCTDSMDFYRRLALKRASTKSIQLIAASNEAVGSLESYIGNHDLTVDRAVQLRMAEFRITSTPTIVLADERGLVVGAWVGKLSGSQEAEVFRRLDK